jgi:hypothetical protein
MRKLLFFLLAITIAFSVAAQDKAATKTKKVKPATAWKAGGSISILGGGGSSKDHYSGLKLRLWFCLWWIPEITC